MKDYRCYLLNAGHIVRAESLSARNDKEAIETSKAIFQRLRDKHSGYEVWQLDRRVFQFDEDRVA